MSTVLDRVTEVQDQVLTAISSTKEPVSNVVSTVVDFVVERAPLVPALPFAGQLPTPKELIDNQAKFASKLVTTNKSVALGVARAAQPLTDQLLDRRSAARTKAA
jgi:hypothetical protein